MNKELFIENIDKIHTTHLGINRIKRNLKLDNVDAINQKNTLIYKMGKNWYCKIESIKIMINTYLQLHIL